jgi:hypothetical protein
MFLINIIFRAPSKEEYFSVDAKDVEMQNMNASGPRRPEGGVRTGQQQGKHTFRNMGVRRLFSRGGQKFSKGGGKNLLFA